MTELKIVPFDEPKPVSTVVAALEVMLARAKAGEIVGFVSVVEVRGPVYEWTISGPLTWAGTVYALERMRHAVHRQIDNQAADTIEGPAA